MAPDVRKKRIEYATPTRQRRLISSFSQKSGFLVICGRKNKGRNKYMNGIISLIALEILLPCMIIP